MNRREFIAGLGSAAAWPLAAWAQQGDRVRRIGVLSTRAEIAPGWQANRTALLDELAKFGWIEGDNVRIEFRFGDGNIDVMRAHAAELVRLAPDVIVTSGNAATRAAQQATPTIPIVMAAGGDPSVTGMFRNLARPEGNITGFSTPEPSIASKWLELLKEAAPNLARIAVLYNPESVSWPHAMSKRSRWRLRHFQLRQSRFPFATSSRSCVRLTSSRRSQTEA
jgi:putative tryptophan/tyrosine transport system substrate-binding protein